jgi:TP901 family phage tail tape measure protein
MAVATMRVPTIFTAVDRFSDVVSKMGAGVNRFGKHTTSALSRVDHKLNNVFNSMNGLSQLAIGGGVGGLFYYAGKDIMEYEVKIASLSAVTGTAIGSMNKQVESLGNKTKMSVIDVAGAFEIVGSKMSQYLQNPEALQSVTDASITLSRAARMELEPAISSLTTMMNIYKLSAQDAAYAVNKLSAGETVGSKSIKETADIIPQFGAQAVRANVSLAESIALVQTLAQSLPTEGIGRGLRNILFDISSTKTWDKNRWKAIKLAGVDFEFVTNNANKLVDRLKELKKLQSVKGGTELFFKRVNSIAANTLFQNLNSGETSLVSFLDRIIKLDDAEQKAAKNMSTLSAFIDKLKASFTNFIVTNNNSNAALSITKSLLGWMTDNMGNIINLVSSVAVAFIGWKVIYGIVSFASGIVSIFNSIMKVNLIITQIATFRAIAYSEALWLVVAAQWAAYWPVLLVIAALGGLVYAFWDTGEAAENSSTKQIDALMEQNKAYMGSTNVLSKELQKQATLIDNHNSKVLSPKQLVSNIINKEAQRKQEVLSNRDLLKPREIKPISEGLMSKLNENYKIDQAYGVSTRQLLRKNGLSYGEIMSSKENLAGKSDNEKFFNFIKNSKGELVVNVKVKGGEVESIDDSNAKGLPVKVTSTKTTTKK